MGLVGYYRRFIINFAQRAAPLYALLQARQSFQWGTDQHTAFEDLKLALQQDVMLHYPDLTRPFILKTDASGKALSGILVQKDDTGNERVVAYASRTLNKVEQNWSASERECIALIWAVKHFNCYLYGTRFYAVTDHAALQYLKTQKDHNAKLMRWSLQLSEYDFDIIHKPGRLHLDADALSRLPSALVAALVHVNALSSSPPERLTLDIIKREQQRDPLCEKIRTALLQSDSTAPNVSTKGYQLHEDVLMRQGEGKRTPTTIWRVVIPPALRHTVLLHMHDHPLTGHMAVARTLKRLEARYYWKNMALDTKLYCEGCVACQTRARAQVVPTSRKPVMMIDTPTRPFDTIVMDFLGPLPRTRDGNRYILVFTDRFTRWVIAVATSNADAISVARALIELIMCQHGAPRNLQSDRGTHFTARIVEAVCAIMDTKQIFGSSYHPNTQGLVERFNGTLANMLAKFTNEQQDDWDLYLKFVVFAYNTADHESLKTSPFKMLFGREPVYPLETAIPPSEESNNEQGDYVDKLKERLHRIRKLGIQNLQRQQQRVEDTRPPLSTLVVHPPNTRVWLFDPVVPLYKSKKLRRAWKGPYLVVRQTGPKSYIVKRPPSQKEIAVSGDRLKPFRNQELTQVHLPPDIPLGVNDGPPLLPSHANPPPPNAVAADTPLALAAKSDAPRPAQEVRLLSRVDTAQLAENHTWKLCSVADLRQYQRIRLHYHEKDTDDVANTDTVVYYYATIIAEGRNKNQRLKWVRVKWEKGCPFEADQEKMKVQQYIPYTDLQHYYTVWVETPSETEGAITGKREREIQIKQIIGQKQEEGKQYYKVRWIDRPEVEASWVPEEQLEQCEDLIAEFHHTNKQKRVRRPHFQTSHAMTISSTDEAAAKQLDILILTPTSSTVALLRHPLDRLTTTYDELFKDPHWRSKLFNLAVTSASSPLQADLNSSAAADMTLLHATGSAKLYANINGQLLRCRRLETRREHFPPPSNVKAMKHEDTPRLSTT